MTGADDQLAGSRTLLGAFENLLRGQARTPVPPEFSPRWQELRRALDRPVGAEQAARTVIDLRRDACDPGAATYVGYVPNAAAPLARTVDAYLSMVNAVAAARVDGHSFVQAEYAAADKVGELAGLPADSRGGVFVQGGTLANFCAMAVARDRWRARHRTGSARTPVVVGSRLTHSSMRVGCRLLDLPFVAVDTTDRGTVDVAALRAAVRTHRGRIVAIVANAGTTTAGAIDPLEDLAEVCNESGTWMHVDAAYGGGILFSSKYSNRVSGIAQADSFVVDPHKWLFCPYDSSLLMYRNAREVHEELKVFQQSHEDAAVYLDFGERHTPDDDTPLQLPNEVGDLALGLSRRPRGVALWALLAAFGPDWIGQQVEAAVDAIASLGDYARSRGVAVPIDPQLSVLLLAKEAWPHARDWDEHWVRPAFDKGFFVSTDEYKGSPVGRLCLINPTVTAAQLEPLIDLIANQT